MARGGVEFWGTGRAPHTFTWPSWPHPAGPYLLELREAQTGHEEKAELTVALLRAEPKAGEEEGQEG